MPPLLDAHRRTQLDEIDRLEASHDVLSPAAYRRLRDLAHGDVAALTPAPRPEAELHRLGAISRAQWAKLKRCVFALRQARAAHAIDATPATRRRLAALRQDAEWQIANLAATRRCIAALASRPESAPAPAERPAFARR